MKKDIWTVVGDADTRDRLCCCFISRHLRNIFAALPETDALKESEKNYRKLEGLIFGKWFIPQQ